MGLLSKEIRLASRPKGEPEESDFELAETTVDEPEDGELRIQTNYLSVDPYMRGLIGRGTSYADQVEIGAVMPGDTVGTVMESNHADFDEGDVVTGYWGWREYVVSDGETLREFDTSVAPMSTALGVLGMPGMTAYFGLLEVGQPTAGETVFVSGAAGAVGSTVGQIARIKGCRVAGSAGSPEKIQWVTDQLGFDGAFNYKQTSERRYLSAIRELCPDGIDVYFDNVGGPITDAVFKLINTGARIAVCGQISQYNAVKTPQGPRKLWYLISKQARAEGFLVYNWEDRWPEARREMAHWMKDGKLKYRETITDGIENAPAAFIGLFHGDNIGKQLVCVHEPEV
jgi:NADPH-dependent curcumin reductase CurA